MKVKQSSERLKCAAKVVLLSLDRNRELSLFSFPFTAPIEGIIHQYKPSEHKHEEWTKVKHVPLAFVEAYFEECWRDVVRWHHASTSTCVAAGSSSLGRGPASFPHLSLWPEPLVASDPPPRSGQVRALQREREVEKHVRERKGACRTRKAC